ncbi:MAG: SpoIID/LytB domain-containing protein [Deltaproteobacteria bacterium]|nr:SpoIID/LytB domain-containing protein [Deltaproteobacteria bacterium]
MILRSLPLVLLVACATSKPATVSPAPSPQPPAPAATPMLVPDAGVVEASLPSPDDALEALWARQLNFKNGTPTVTVRLMEGQDKATFSARAPMHLHAHGGLNKEVNAPANVPFTVRLASADAAEQGFAVQVGEFAVDDRDALAAAKQLWTSRGYEAHALTEGAVYGIAGHVLDNRHTLLLLGPHGPKAQARAMQDEIGQKFGEATLLHTTLLKRPSGVLEVSDANGNVLAQAQDLVVVDDDQIGFDVKQVEYGVGYSWHGFADRSYRGQLLFTVDPQGKLAVVNAVPLEELLRGLVPSEIPAKAHAEALKAQAVTARGEVLAKIGVRHLEDPYLFCSEQHCQVYSGIGGETAATDAAIKATAGEALFLPNGGKLVDTVYSAICGGYTENNENVWAGPQNPALRGVPDVIGDDKSVPATLTDSSLPGFLNSKAAFACKLASASTASKFRWTKRFTASEVDAMLATLKVGHVLGMKVTQRGVSGRAIALTVSGDAGASEIRGELNIRKAFKNLPSGMFVLASEGGKSGPSAWTFSGGGWGHGVGMCQIGAIGRAEHGQTYRDILAHYFQGSELVKVY